MRGDKNTNRNKQFSDRLLWFQIGFAIAVLLFIVYLFLKKGKNYYEGKQKTA